MNRIKLRTVMFTLLITPAIICRAEFVNGVAKPLAPTNSSMTQCQALSKLTLARLRLLANTGNPYWSHANTRKIYVIAISHGINGLREFSKNDVITMRDKTAILMAAAVRHDLKMMETYYNEFVGSYSVRLVSADPLVWSSMCNFSAGVTFLLNQGVDPNAYHGNNSGPFNLALLYDETNIPLLLLRHGYKIDDNYKTCASSKYILGRRRSHIQVTVAEAIDAAVCTK